MHPPAFSRGGRAGGGRRGPRDRSKNFLGICPGLGGLPPPFLTRLDSLTLLPKLLLLYVKPQVGVEIPLPTYAKVDPVGGAGRHRVNWQVVRQCVVADYLWYSKCDIVHESLAETHLILTVRVEAAGCHAAYYDNRVSLHEIGPSL